MQSKRSYFNKTLFLKNITRFWPLWAGFGAIWLLLLPGALFSEATRGHLTQREALELPLGLAVNGGVMLAWAFGCFFAMALFSYLFNHRAAATIHSLPLSRPCLFLTNYLSGLCFFLVPLAVVFLLSLAVEGAFGMVEVKPLLIWLGCLAGYLFFFFSFAVFCAMFTGSLIALPVFYGVLSVLTHFVALLLGGIFSMLVFGYSYLNGMDQVAAALAPLVNLMRRVGVNYLPMDPEAPLGSLSEIPLLYGWKWIVAYALVGLVLTVIALLLYRRRQVESAGDLVSVRIVRPVFKYGVTFCTALALGTILFAILGDSSDPRQVWLLLAFLVVGSFIGHFAAEMLLQKSFRVFKKRTWAGFGVSALVLVVLICAMEFDVTGYERRVPDSSQVQSVYVSHSSLPPYDQLSSSIDFTDPQAVEEILALHRTIIEEKSAQEWAQYEYRTNGTLSEVGDYCSITLTYTLENGARLSRSYALTLYSSQLEEEDSLASQLLALVNRPEWREDFFEIAERDTVGLNYVDLNGLYAVSDQGFTRVTVSLTGKEAQQVYDAMKLDMAEGSLGRMWLWEDPEYLDSVYAGSVEFSLRYPTSAYSDDMYYYMDSTTEASASYYSLSLNKDCAHTLAVLEELGLMDSDKGRMLTVGQRDELSNTSEWMDSVTYDYDDWLEAAEPEEEVP